MIKISTHWKIALGYCLFIAMLAFSGWLLYVNTQSQKNVTQASALITQRQDAADQLVYSILEINNAERAICLGLTDHWALFDKAVIKARQATLQLRRLVRNRQQQVRIDSLNLLLNQKYSNMQLVMAEITRTEPDPYYNKVKNLYNGRDSLVVHPNTTETKEDKQTVYEVVKSKRGFFARLADAFRRQHTDTVNVRHEGVRQTIDTVKHRINLADTVADVLTAIKREANREKENRKEDINRKGQSLQVISVQLTQRTQQLLEDIQDNEQLYIKKAFEKDLVLRRAALYKMGVLATFSVLSALILLFFIYRDMRHERLYREHLEEAKAETERVMAQRERLLLTITHDIKAPAASISGFIELLDELVHGEKAKFCLNNIRSSATHLLHLVTALLDYHQLENGRVKPHAVSFNPAQLVRNSVNERMPQAQSKGIQLTCDTLSCGQEMCQADAFRIKQILDNLISNALKYTDRGEVNVTLRLRGRNLILTVSDTGKGMTPAETQRVFKAFTRLPDAQGTEGVGLGLAITHEVVELLGGHIHLRSQKGVGTVFTVSIPISTPSVSAPVSRPSQMPNKSILSTPDDTHKVLVIDDDPLQLQLLKEMFGRITSGRWNVITCQHTSEALHTVAIWKPQLLLADIEMPEMNGSELIQRIDHSQMMVVAMTAHEPSIEEELHDAGFDACLFKPFHLTQLKQLLQQITGNDITVSDTHAETTNSKSLFAPLTAFAEGDKEAERDILLNLRQSLTTYLEQLDTPAPLTNKDLIAGMAHKLQPIAAMLQMKTLPQIKSLSPETISTLTDETVTAYIGRIKRELIQLKRALDEVLQA